MNSSTAKTQTPDPKSLDDPVCGRDKALLVEFEHVPGDAEAELRAAVLQTGCRLYSGAEGGPLTFVVSGHPEQMGFLRSLLVKVPSLRLAREKVEASLGALAAPHGLPSLDAEHYRLAQVAEEMPVARGTTLLVTRDFTFDAAHNLPRYHGKCERLHGHTFKLQVTVKAPLDTWSGMSFDFHDLKDVVQRRVLQILDHAYVNEIIPNPSAEFIAIWSWEQLSDLPLFEIKVWETPSCHVTYHGPTGA